MPLRVGASTARRATAVRRSAATVSAVFTPASASNIRISSEPPPARHTTSSTRVACLAAAPIARSTRSPAGCPYWVLIALKWSTSTTSTAAAPPRLRMRWRRAGACCAQVQRSSRPVTVSQGGRPQVGQASTSGGVTVVSPARDAGSPNCRRGPAMVGRVAVNACSPLSSTWPVDVPRPSSARVSTSTNDTALERSPQSNQATSECGTTVTVNQPGKITS